MHGVKELKEELCGILTLNYDDIVEKAIQNVKKGINYSINVKNRDSRFNFKKANNIFPYIKLHGSFNWKRNYPVEIVAQEKIKEEEDVLWLPPGVEKKREKYPFNVLWSNAKNVLDCDVLRIIGCSLNRNDWQLISLLFSMQKINSSGKFSIEMITREETDHRKGVKRDYPFLKIKTITEIDECVQYLKDFYDLDPDAALSETVRETVSKNNTKINIFEWWLRAKGNQITRNKKYNLTTKTNIFENFIKQKNS
jgi:hypothetical protein